MFAIAIALAIFAGLLTTTVGVGGGMILLLSLSILWDPWRALATTAPALLIGNAHRVSLFREDVSWRTAGAILIGAVPASIFGGMMVSSLPAMVLYAAMLVTVVLALLRRAGKLDWTPSPKVMIPAGVVIGLFAAGAGGAGIMVAPLLLAAGLSGPAYVGTGATIAVGMHLGRLTGYGIDGMVTSQTLVEAVILAAAITAGNLIGMRLRDRLSEGLSRRLEVGALLTAVTFTLIAAARG